MKNLKKNLVDNQSDKKGSFSYSKFSSLRTKVFGLVVIAISSIALFSIVNPFINYYNISRTFAVQEKLLLIDQITHSSEESLVYLRDYISDPYVQKSYDQYIKCKNSIKIKQKEIIKNKFNEAENELKSFTASLDLFLDLCDTASIMGKEINPDAKSFYTKLPYYLENLKQASINLTMKELYISNQAGQNMNTLIIMHFIISFSVTILIAGFCLYHISRIMKHIKEILDKLVILSNQISEGKRDLSLLDSKGNDEITVLSNAFDQMIVSLKKAHEEIDSRQNKMELLNKELTASNNQLLEANLEIKEAQEKLIQSEKMAALGGMVAGVAHEINTPVGVSITAASFQNEVVKEFQELYNENRVKKSDMDTFINQVSECGDLVLRNLQKTSALINNFKQVAVDQSKEEKRVFAVKEYINLVLIDLNPNTKDFNVIIGCDEDILVNSYPGALFQIFTQLIMNTVHHAYQDGEKGKIQIQVQKREEGMFLSYTDFGKGIKKENLNKVFEPFFTTNRINGGLGLGLNIVFNTVTSKLGGQITCQSEVGQWTTFEILFPAEFPALNVPL